MNRDEFIKYIESIGFIYNGRSYSYKYYIIEVFKYGYDFYPMRGKYMGNITPSFIDLDIIEFHFKKEIRSIKLKKLLK